MRQNFLIRLFCLCLFPVFTMAQNTDNFRQPYPLVLSCQEASAKNFIGQAYIAPITVNRELNVPMSNVTLSLVAGITGIIIKRGADTCRVSRHRLLSGKGETGQKIVSGDIVEIAPDVIHWHGRLRIAGLLTLP